MFFALARSRIGTARSPSRSQFDPLAERSKTTYFVFFFFSFFLYFGFVRFSLDTTVQLRIFYYSFAFHLSHSVGVLSVSLCVWPFGHVYCFSARVIAACCLIFVPLRHFTSPKSYREMRTPDTGWSSGDKNGKRGDQCANIASRGESICCSAVAETCKFNLTTEW